MSPHRRQTSRKRDEPVRLTRIYTRGGDAGQTSLGDGSRVSKLDPRVGAYGAVDELNAQVGVVLALNPPDEVREPLARIQNDLFDLGADLSVPFSGGEQPLRVSQEQIDELERLCDLFNERLPELKSFVLPGGNELAARLHVARAVCRRAELVVLATARQVEVDRLVPIYLNRLSDLLFIFARTANLGGEEPVWQPGAGRGEP
jgi:cob(I)alamin adenosyltransferase